MPSGGARTRSGPPADPNALRRDRKSDETWTTLPTSGFSGVAPAWPLSTANDEEHTYWLELWQKPQALMWERLGLARQVAAYARSFVEATERDAAAGLKTAVLRMEGELGVSVPGMHALRWRIAEDEVAVRREQGSGRPDARARLRVIGGGS